MSQSIRHFSTDPEQLRLRAKVLQIIRRFFVERDVMEVNTPLMADAPVTDPYLHALTVQCNGETQYLQTSPEYAMKRLLAAGSGCIYQICQAFRDEESGPLHQPEFTMLEWYRVGLDDHQLMQEVSDLLQQILHGGPAEKWSYQQCFETYCGINPHSAEVAVLDEVMVAQQISVQSSHPLGRDDKLQLLFSQCIEPHLGHMAPAIVYDFPASQAALAKLRVSHGQLVAARFEVYVQGVELANGYHELTDAAEQERRFQQDLIIREAQGLPAVPIDHALLDAMHTGLPECAGIALGVDRLLMLALS